MLSFLCHCTAAGIAGHQLAAAGNCKRLQRQESQDDGCFKLHRIVASSYIAGFRVAQVVPDRIGNVESELPC